MTYEPRLVGAEQIQKYKTFYTCEFVDYRDDHRSLYWKFVPKHGELDHDSCFLKFKHILG